MNTIHETNKIWQNATKEQRVKLLKAVGFNSSWAEAESLQEMQERGGAWVARELVRLYQMRQETKA